MTARCSLCPQMWRERACQMSMKGRGPRGQFCHMIGSDYTVTSSWHESFDVDGIHVAARLLQIVHCCSKEGYQLSSLLESAGRWLMTRLDLLDCRLTNEIPTP